jgi:hypothetical protein
MTSLSGRHPIVAEAFRVPALPRNSRSRVPTPRCGPQYYLRRVPTPRPRTAELPLRAVGGADKSAASGR